MKKLLVAASAIGLIASTPAMAADGEINLSGTVGKACGVGNHISGSGTAAGYTAGDITNIPLADGNGQFNGVTYTKRSFGNLWCNAPATVTMTVTPLTTPVTAFDSGSFVNRLDVEVTTNAGVYFAGGAPMTLSTATGGTSTASNTVPGAFETGTGQYGGVESLKILAATRTAGGNYRPVAGDYTGSVTFTASVN